MIVWYLHSSENRLPLNPLAYYHVSFFKWLFERYYIPFSGRPISDMCWSRLLRVEMITEQTWRAAAQGMCFQRCAALKETTAVRYQTDFAGIWLVNWVSIKMAASSCKDAKVPDVVATCFRRHVPLEIKVDNGNPACLPAWEATCMTEEYGHCFIKTWQHVWGVTSEDKWKAHISYACVFSSMVMRPCWNYLLR